MKRFLKWAGGLFLAALVAVIALAVNVIWFRPVSIAFFYERAFIEFALEDPELLTSIRMLEGMGIDGHNAELTDASPLQTQKMYGMMHESLDTLHSYDRDKLDGQKALSYDILDWYLQQQLDGERFQWHEYAIDQFNGIHTFLPNFLVDTHQVHSVRDAEHYVQRLSKVGWKFDGLLESLRLREERGIVPPQFAIEGALEQIRKFSSPEPEANVLYTSFEARLDGLDELDAAERDRLLADARRAIETSVYPAYATLAEYVTGLKDRIHSNHGVWMLPDGDAFYRYKLAQHTTTQLEPDEIHALGVAEVRRIESEMDSILVGEAYTDGSVGERMRVLNEEPRFLYPDTDEGRQQVIAELEGLVERANKEVDDWFRRKPVAAVEIRRMPDYMEENNALGFYMGPAFDGSRPGVFYVKLATTAEHPRFKLPVLAFHEAIPGHHFQIALQTELEGVAQFRRIIPFTAYSEGWGLYTEQLASEMGLIEDPYEQLGRLQTELWRAVRLVVDTGIHNQRWSREEAIDYMQAHTGIPASDVIAEIERYFVMPGQATAYKVGMLKILELRARARDRLGDAFDIREFHDVVLRDGAMPLAILERQVDAWIDGQQG